MRKTIEMEDSLLLYLSLLCHNRIRMNNLTDIIQVERHFNILYYILRISSSFFSFIILHKDFHFEN